MNLLRSTVFFAEYVNKKVCGLSDKRKYRAYLRLERDRMAITIASNLGRDAKGYAEIVVTSEKGSLCGTVKHKTPDKRLKEFHNFIDVVLIRLSDVYLDYVEQELWAKETRYLLDKDVNLDRVSK